MSQWDERILQIGTGVSLQEPHKPTRYYAVRLQETIQKALYPSSAITLPPMPATYAFAISLQTNMLTCLAPC